MLQHYTYTGPVMEFNVCINHRWTGSTFASSEKKARSNLIYRFKELTGRSISSKITLPGEISGS